MVGGLGEKYKLEIKNFRATYLYSCGILLSVFMLAPKNIIQEHRLKLAFGG